MISFSIAKNVSDCDVRRQIVEVCCKESMRRDHVAKCCRTFQPGKNFRSAKVEQGNFDPTPYSPDLKASD